ncbi:hypothetical protein E4U11_007736 [Claviceps purpurea]|nr:hypothetical protein E4U11_007736 [Claviceps purpurea]
MLLWAGDGGARKIVISRDTEITQPTLTLLLEASPRLEYLKIGSLQGNLTFPSDKKTWDRLRHVSIGGSFDRTPVDLPGGFPQMFLQNAASTLEHLNLVSIPKEWYKSVPSIPVLPKLKTLLIHGFQDAGTPFTIYPLSIAFPRLEQLYINSLFNLHPEPVAIWRKEQENIWPHLKVLIFQPHVLRLRDYDEARTHSTLQYLTSLNSGNSLQHIQFRFDLHCNFDFFPHAQFQNLRSLRSKTMWMSPDRARTLLSNAVRNKKLNSFDIVFPNPYGDPRLTADACVRHLEGYEWLRGTPTIHTLGCQDFYSSFDPEDEDGRLLPQFLATFPNLRTLIITTPLYYTKAELAKLILAILKATQLKTIYVRYFTVETFGWLEEAARSKGTKIIEGSEPSIWPIPLDQ